MEHVPRWFTDEPVKALLKGYSEGILDRPVIEDMLGICKTRFFALSPQAKGKVERLYRSIVHLSTFPNKSQKHLTSWGGGDTVQATVRPLDFGKTKRLLV